MNVQSARDFIEWAEREKRPEPWKLENWREALRWFFRAAKAEQAGFAAEGKDQALGGGLRLMELLRHESVETTMIYLHSMRQKGVGVRSPLDE